MTDYLAAENRYDDQTSHRRCGRSGLDLPAISLGLWHNFGDDRPLDVQRAILRRAFDLGITHVDLANNYGLPYVTESPQQPPYGRQMASGQPACSSPGPNPPVNRSRWRVAPPCSTPADSVDTDRDAI